VETRAQELSAATWLKAEEAVKSGRISKIIIPIGSLEQHGPHLPLSTDTVIADYVAGQVSKRCSNTFLVPPIQFGCSSEHIGFSGTISLQPDTLSSIILDISSSLLKSRFTKAFIINGHGGNRPTLAAAITKITQFLPEIHVYAFTIIDIAKEKFDEMRKSKERLVGHADEIETSMMLSIQPEIVDMAKAVRELPSFPDVLSFESKDLARISFGWKAKEVTKTGVIGDPLHANAKTGQVLLDFAVDTISKIIDEL
jgi:creatinine amidohydrolase